MDCKCAGTEYLAQKEGGGLEGEEAGAGTFHVWPAEEYLAESVLKYSAVPACFEISGLDCAGKKARVKRDEPADRNVPDMF